MPNLPTDSSKKLPTVGGVGVKNREKFADVLNGWSHTRTPKMNLLKIWTIILFVILERRIKRRILFEIFPPLWLLCTAVCLSLLYPRCKYRYYTPSH